MMIRYKLLLGAAALFGLYVSHSTAHMAGQISGFKDARAIYSPIDLPDRDFESLNNFDRLRLDYESLELDWQEMNIRRETTTRAFEGQKEIIASQQRVIDIKDELLDSHQALAQECLDAFEKIAGPVRASHE